MQVEFMNFLRASYAELEKITGIPACNWSRYFNGKRKLSMKNLDRIAESLNLEPSDALKLIELRQKQMRLRNLHKVSAVES